MPPLRLAFRVRNLLVELILSEKNLLNLAA